MSATAVGWVYEHSPYKGAAFAVHLAIADTVNDQNDNELWSSVARLSDKARVERKTASKAVRKMVDQGFLELLKERPGDTSLYRFVFVADLSVVYEVRGRRSGRSDPGSHDPGSSNPTTEDPGSTDPGGFNPGSPEPTRVPTTRGAGSHDPGPGSSGPTNPIEPKVEPKNKPKEDMSASADVRACFDFWKTEHNHPKAVLSPDRSRVIKRALKDHGKKDVAAAIRGIKKSVFHMGGNPDGTVYDDIKVILKNTANVEKFRDLETGDAPTPRQPTREADFVPPGAR